MRKVTNHKLAKTSDPYINLAIDVVESHKRDFIKCYLRYLDFYPENEDIAKKMANEEKKKGNWEEYPENLVAFDDYMEIKNDIYKNICIKYMNVNPDDVVIKWKKMAKKINKAKIESEE